MGRRLLAGLASVVMLLVPFRPHWEPPRTSHHTVEAPIPEPGRDSRIYWIGADRAWDCSGVLWVGYSEQNLVDGHLVQRQHDGAVRVEVHDYSGRFGPGGQWMEVPVDRDNGSRLGWSGFRQAQQYGGHMDLVRVVHTRDPRLISAPALIEGECLP
jgi:hypothetical protein